MDKIIDTLSYVKPEYIDMAGIKAQLDQNRKFDIQVLDKLYLMNLLSKEEYIHYIERIIQLRQEEIRFLETVIDDMNSTLDYNVLGHYGFGYDFSFGSSR